MSKQEEVAGEASTKPATPPILLAPLPIMCEIIGENATGKTHLASCFPRPFLIDTTPKGESRAVFAKLNPDRTRYAHVQNWTELIAAAKPAMARFDVATIIIDTSADLQDLARDEYLKRNPSRKGVMQYEYGRVRDIIDVELIFKVCALPPNGVGKNLVFTSQMKDLYTNAMDNAGQMHSTKTGRKTDGYSRSDFECDLRFYLSLKEVMGENGVKYERRVDVVKNRWTDKASDAWIPTIKSSWLEVKKLIKPLKDEVIVE